MNTLVICKIAAPALRRQIYSRLKNRGICVSQGIFECDFDASELEKLQVYMRSLPYSSTDFIMIYSLCAHCQSKKLAFGIGLAEQSANDDWVII